MARIIGSLKAEDDYTHALGAEPNFNESMYFNFFDRRHGLGGFLRLGNRANEGYAELTATVFLPDGRVLFDFQRPAIADNRKFDAGGMHFEVVEPSERLRTAYDGDMLELRDPRVMANPKKAFLESPRVKAALDLVHEAVGPMYGSAHDEQEAGADHERQFAKAHYEQHMHVTGTLVFDDARYQIDGYGLRDHSWGPRYWQAIHSYEWLTMNFGPDFGAMVSIVRRSADDLRIGGVVVRGERADFLKDARIEIDYEPDSLYHRGLSVEVTTEDDESLRITGQVKSFIPLRNRRSGQTTHVGEGMTEWRCGEHTGYGLSELLRQV